ncbi:hypothetical protein GGH17_001733 [Coemansia sp. RSA 788]|nr:hypothetical protein GGH17_001733 [Coemansia sp. RSA 788]
MIEYDTDDVDTLRHRLHETTSQLEAAAHMGLELAQHNTRLQQRVDTLESTHDDLRQRMSAVERDRRWMHEQSLRVDQMRVSVTDLLARDDATRTRLTTTDRHNTELNMRVQMLQTDVEAMAQVVDNVQNGARRANEHTHVQRALSEARDRISELAAALNEAEERVRINEERQRVYRALVERRVGELDARVTRGEMERKDGEERLEWLVVKREELDQTVQSMAAEYAEMLGDHEQAIRGLRADACMHYDDSFANPLVLQTPQTALRTDPRYAMHADSDSGVDVRCLAGESMGDIFANDSLQYDEHQLSFPSPPLSMASHCARPEASVSPLARVPRSEASVSPLARVSRKAVSVIGTSYRTPQRPRARVSSFSGLNDTNRSGAPKVSHLGAIISPTAHVGVGWGNYWEARKHLLQFDLQSRLGLSAAGVCHKQVSGAGDLDTAD